MGILIRTSSDDGDLTTNTHGLSVYQYIESIHGLSGSELKFFFEKLFWELNIQSKEAVMQCLWQSMSSLEKEMFDMPFSSSDEVIHSNREPFLLNPLQSGSQRTRTRSRNETLSDHGRHWTPKKTEEDILRIFGLSVWEDAAEGRYRNHGLFYESQHAGEVNRRNTNLRRRTINPDDSPSTNESPPSEWQHPEADSFLESLITISPAFSLNSQHDIDQGNVFTDSEPSGLGNATAQDRLSAENPNRLTLRPRSRRGRRRRLPVIPMRQAAERNTVGVNWEMEFWSEYNQDRESSDYNNWEDHDADWSLTRRPPPTLTDEWELGSENNGVLIHLARLPSANITSDPHDTSSTAVNEGTQSINMDGNSNPIHLRQ